MKELSSVTTSIKNGDEFPQIFQQISSSQNGGICFRAGRTLYLYQIVLSNLLHEKELQKTQKKLIIWISYFHKKIWSPEMFKDHKLPEISEDIISYVFDNFRGGQPVIICLFFYFWSHRSRRCLCELVIATHFLTYLWRLVWYKDSSSPASTGRKVDVLWGTEIHLQAIQMSKGALPWHNTIASKLSRCLPILWD